MSGATNWPGGKRPAVRRLLSAAAMIAGLGGTAAAQQPFPEQPPSVQVIPPPSILPPQVVPSVQEPGPIVPSVFPQAAEPIQVVPIVPMAPPAVAPVVPPWPPGTPATLPPWPPGAPSARFGSPPPSSGTATGTGVGAGGATGSETSSPTSSPTSSNIQNNPVPSNAPKFEAVWNNGLFFQTKDKDFIAHVGATVQYDGAWYSAQQSLQRFPGGTGPFNDGVNLRRGRMFLEGSFYRNIDYKFELEFFNGFSPSGLTPAAAAPNNTFNTPGPTDAWITAKNIPILGNVRVGSQKEWFSLEHLNSYRNLEFMERSYLFDFSQATAFNNGFTPGISAFRTWANDRVFTAVGAYKNDSDLYGYGVGDGQYAVTGRVAFLPVYCPDQEYFWHVGGAMSHRDPVAGQVQVRVRNEVRNAPFPLLNLIANTGAINATSQDLFNIETAAVNGPVTFQGEYTANLIHRASVGTGPSLGTLRYQGFYAETLVFLTGESRQWDPKNAFFRRVIPKKNFLTSGDGGWCVDGMGAWELGLRYTYLNVDDKGVNGGRLNNVTLGLNWYLNPNAKFQFNYDYLYRDAAANPLAKGNVHSLGSRLSYDF